MAGTDTIVASEFQEMLSDMEYCCATCYNSDAVLNCVKFDIMHM